MKFILKIAIGVFLGQIATMLALEGYQNMNLASSETLGVIFALIIGAIVLYLFLSPNEEGTQE